MQNKEEAIGLPFYFRRNFASMIFRMLCGVLLWATLQMAVAGALSALQLGLVINDEEPNSVIVGEMYRAAHDIPPTNVVHVRIPDAPRRLSLAAFEALRRQINARLPAEVRATLMVWTAPYAVECNSITSAYTNGYDAEQCLKSCGPGHMSPFFGQMSDDVGAVASDAGRISMLLPTESVELARALIARGQARYMTHPKATAYYLVTSDSARNARAKFFPPNGKFAAQNLTVRQMRADALEGVQDILIYQTGMARVAKLDTLRFLPGALADHLTSAGGDLLSDYQMSSLRWLEAGATASYGTVSEPCNYWQKFPHPALLLKNYVNGATAIEAYWRSVAWPAQGVFIGDPLAAPYKRGD